MANFGGGAVEWIGCGEFSEALLGGREGRCLFTMGMAALALEYSCEEQDILEQLGVRREEIDSFHFTMKTV